MDDSQRPQDYEPLDDERQEDIPDGLDGGRTVGIAFILGVVVGAAASTLLQTTAEDEPRTRRLIRRTVRREPKALGQVVRDEAAAVATSVLRELGGAATRWILDAAAAPEREKDASPGLETVGERADRDEQVPAGRPQDDRGRT